jgi:hypothetical protein
MHRNIENVMRLKNLTNSSLNAILSSVPGKECDMRFRENRGSLDESLKTLVKLENRDALVKHCQKLLAPYNFRFDQSALEILEISPYSSGPDKRTGWKCTYIVRIEGYGVMGFTDSLN